jgi:caffeoyl-CoA O-methyltransferase
VPDDPKSFFLSPAISDYLIGHGCPPDEIQQRLIAETKTLGAVAGMQIAPEQGAFLTILTRLIDASQAVEVGTFTGYSALSIARGLPTGGRLLCCDVNEEWTSIGRRYWAEAGLSDRIELRLGPAVDTLRALPAGAWLDLAFIDADKPNYGRYYDEILSRLRPNGVILVDNVLWHGAVVDDTHDANVDAIRAFNDRIAGDDRVEAVMLPISDGLTMIRKR